MPAVTRIDVPADSLLAARVRPGDYADCYSAQVPGTVPLDRYISAFFASSVFLTERTLLRLIGRGAGREDVAALAEGRTDRFAAWSVEAREPDQLLMRDFLGKTRCWLKVEPGSTPDTTRLCFGSWVGASSEGDSALTGNRLSMLTNLAYPFHRAYSRVLLAGAVRGLRS